MNLIQKALLRLSGIPLPQAQPMISTTVTPGIVTWQADNLEGMVKDGYCGNDLVYSIIRVITEKAKVAPWVVYKVTDEKKYKQHLAAIEAKDWKLADELKSQALEPAKDQRLEELLKYPNEEDTWADLVESWGVYKLVTGNAFVAARMIEAGANMGKPLELFMLPSQYMQIMADVQQYPAKRVGYQLYMGLLQKYSVEEVLHDKYINPRADATGGQLYGLSPLQAASRLVTRSNDSKTASVALLQNGGPSGVLYAKPQPAMGYDGAAAVAQVDAIKASMKGYQGPYNKNKIAVSGWEMGYTPIGLSNVDMDIINMENHDRNSLCAVYNVPPVLIGNTEASSYNNMMTANKQLTSNAALPLLYSMCSNLNRKLKTDWGYSKGDLVVGFDESVYKELQDDMAVKVKWVNELPTTLRHKFELLGQPVPDMIPDSILDTVYYNNNPVDSIPNDILL